MKYDYVFYTTDASFDYGDFPGGTFYQTDYHGFSIEISEDGTADIDTLEPYGDYAAEMSGIKTLSQLQRYVLEHLHEAQNEEVFSELLEINV